MVPVGLQEIPEVVDSTALGPRVVLSTTSPQHGSLHSHALRSLGYALHKGAFRDALFLRYG